MNNRLRILICPLNWGLGHATRMVPVIRQCIQQEIEVIIAADGEALEFLRKEFPNLKFFSFPQYQVEYSSTNSQVFSMLRIIPEMVFSSIKEHFILKRIIKKEQIKCVISDNRYGLWNRSVHSIFITHQLRVIFPGVLNLFKPVFQWMVKSIIRKYDECWIPDFSGDNNLSGKLSHGFNYPTLNYIGPLSRFKKEDLSNEEKKTYDCLLILSGPEPQRTILEQRFYDQIALKDYKAAIVRGINSKEILEPTANVDVFELLDSKTLLQLIAKSELVICRSGYSSIMDMVALNKTAVLVPTPGQTEQEFLSDYLYKKGFFYTLSQKEFCIDKAMKNKIVFSKNSFDLGEDLLKQKITDLKRLLENIENNKGNK